MLKELLDAFDIEQDQFSTILEKHAPSTIKFVEDPEMLFGLTADMSVNQKRDLLNREYRKWNARVTNTNPEIQNQAEQMLTLIAQARSKYAK